MHPDQFIVLNSKNRKVVERSIAELYYHAEILDLMKLKNDSKIQLHIGGRYDDKNKSISRFIKEFKILDDKIRNRLVIENDDHIYKLNDCLILSEKIDIPILFDYFHHLIYNNNENIKYCYESVKKTWKDEDGIPMIDYSSQKHGFKIGRHAETLDEKDFNATNIHVEKDAYDMFAGVIYDFGELGGWYISSVFRWSSTRVWYLEKLNSAEDSFVIKFSFTISTAIRTAAAAVLFPVLV